MRLDKFKAYKLRLQGRSYGEINKILGVPKATLSDWFNSLELSQKAQERIRSRAYKKSVKSILEKNRLQTSIAQKRARDIRQAAKKEIGNLSKRELFLIGIALYWAEGYKRPIVRNGKVKTSHPVSMTNSNPLMVKIFLKFLREVCHVSNGKITANVRIYEHQSESYLLDFWQKVTDIPPDKFQKFYYGISKSGQGKRPFNILPYGTIQIRVNGGTELYHKIMGWIDGLSQA